MAQFNVPAQKPNQYLDLNNLQGLDNRSLAPDLMRAAKLINIVKKNGLHQIRDNIKQTYKGGN